MRRVRIRDFLETEDMIFSVVTYKHPSNHYNALLRFVRDPRGERTRDNINYRKLSFQEAVNYINTWRPEYGDGEPHKVPDANLKRIVRPKKALSRLNKEGHAEITTITKKLLAEGANSEDLGITGSHLVGLDQPSSDIDFVAYGLKGFKAARLALRKGIKNGGIRSVEEETWGRIYRKRSPELDFDEFIEHEKRKFNRGMIGKRYFDLLFTRSWSEIKDIPSRGKKREKMVVEAKVTDDSFCFDSPAIYEVEHPEIDRVASYTHTYAGQVFKGEELQAKGWVEESEKETLLVVGTSRKAKGEWIRSLDLIKNR
ncbi:hypothetical protein AKJ58_00840 [candidate division MSBL1 archaeon SCGC-AAA385D11]|uniref:Polymerase nucleotidyl transferase domain-containing protein n=1 Tax=candidate division MSBL1 archaeon SCGC-AAA385D11 TaxID=1698286 RepID=A0A133VNW4_9EURY|nr:hypothetical protein AKJ58_00840 [candidate division MSBL1 archaeon SCGC-AAA385D11]